MPLATTLPASPSITIGLLVVEAYWRSNMSKVVKCRDIGVDCDFEARGDTEREVLKQCADHARTEHGMDPIPADLVAKVKAAIRDEKAA
jgi:predicted small metal-binding protein